MSLSQAVVAAPRTDGIYRELQVTNRTAAAAAAIRAGLVIP